jgi:hypothetical protein
VYAAGVVEPNAHSGSVLIGYSRRYQEEYALCRILPGTHGQVMVVVAKPHLILTCREMFTVTFEAERNVD